MAVTTVIWGKCQSMPSNWEFKDRVGNGTQILYI